MKISTAGQNAIIGALVADAAAMGLHWLYDQARIAELASDSIEFRTPDANDFEGVAGYFAHPKKQAGDLSQYGEQLMVMLRSLAAHDGEYDQARYQSAFREHFGYGGDYVGYIDRATRDTLNNVARSESEAIEQALALPFDGDDDLKRRLIFKVQSGSKQASGAGLRAQVERAVRYTDDSDANVEHAFKMIDVWEATSGYPGADDWQLPATAKLPALIACYAGKSELHSVAESAIRVTNNNDRAAAFGLAATDMMEAAILTGDTEQSVQAGKNTGHKEVVKLLDDALAMRDQSSAQATSHFGLACDLNYGVPSVAHNVIKSGSYAEAIHQNIAAGGDNCGRAIIVGAIAGACYGVGGSEGIPEAWLTKVGVMADAQSCVDSLS